jgi:hypothetical protein
MSAKATKFFIIGTFVTLYLLVSIISTIHVIDFFLMSNPKWLAVSLAIAFEVGAAASLAAIITLEKMNKGMVWGLFILLTLMQAMGNTYYTYIHLKDFSGWIELFGLVDEELIYQKRILSMVSGAILPIVALGFIKSLVDYIRPSEIESAKKAEEETLDAPKPNYQSPTFSEPDEIEPIIEHIDTTTTTTKETVETTTFSEPEEFEPIVEIVDTTTQETVETTTFSEPEEFEPIIEIVDTTTQEMVEITTIEPEKPDIKRTPEDWTPIAGSDRGDLLSATNSKNIKQEDSSKNAVGREVDNTRRKLSKDELTSRGFRVNFRDSV